MKKLLFAEYESAVLAALYEDGQPVSLSFLAQQNGPQAGDIVIARVEQVKKDISSAFVSIAPGQTAYLQLSDPAQYRQGDLIAVAVERGAAKNKHAQVTDRLALYGTNVAVMEGKKPVGISARIREEAERERLKALLTGFVSGHAGDAVTCIARTNAVFAPPEAVLKEAEDLLMQLKKLRARVPFAALHTRLYAAEPEAVRLIRDNAGDGELSVITDVPSVYGQAETFQKESGGAWTLRLYEDEPLPLVRAYALENLLQEVLQKKVWLRSGGYLVIEPTEALTVIDVNTGKYTPSGKSTAQQTFLKLDLEAARAVARELRLRNISGIVIVDFIDLKEGADRETLIRTLKEEIAKDPVRTSFHGITALGLAELTRKKTGPPLAEQAERCGVFSAKNRRFDSEKRLTRTF